MDKKDEISSPSFYGDQLILDNETSPSKIAIMYAGKLVEFLSFLPS